MLVELQYDLTRRQRLIPHLRVWGLAQVILMFGLCATAAVAVHGSWMIAGIFGILCLWFGRGYILGLIDIIFVESKHMDIHIKDNGLGYMAGKERWYIHLDGLTAIKDLEKSIWTIEHHNGTVVNIPKKVLSDEHLRFLRSWIDRNHDRGRKPDTQSSYPSARMKTPQDTNANGRHTL